jgi:hypothetical protein
MMFKYLRVKQDSPQIAPDHGAMSVQELMGDFALPISIRTINGLPMQAKQRIYRMLIPSTVLTRFNINPITWRGEQGEPSVILKADPETGVVNVSMKDKVDSSDVFFCIELADNSFNGVDLPLLLLNDPATPRFKTDYDDEGKPTMFGTLRRNLVEEERAMRAGLAPGQIRSSLSASQLVFQQLDAFLLFLGHHAVSLEPLTYASAWVFERRGFAYMRGHKLMDDIHSEFQPDGRLHKTLDGSTPFRQPDQWRTVRGRAWAIHDGVLSAVDAKWDGLRMVKQVGQHAGVNTFPDAAY